MSGPYISIDENRAMSAHAERLHGAISGGLITTTVLAPRVASPGIASIDITAIPSKWFDYDPAIEGVNAVVSEFGVRPYATLSSTDLTKAIATIVEIPEDGQGSYYMPAEFARGYPDDIGPIVDRIFTSIEASTVDGVRPSVAHSHIVNGESAIIELSPARRTSPAGVAASRLASQIMLAGTTGTGLTSAATNVLQSHGDPTSALLTFSQTSPFLFIVGSAITLVMSAGGASIVLVSRWLGTKVKEPQN